MLQSVRPVSHSIDRSSNNSYNSNYPRQLSANNLQNNSGDVNSKPNCKPNVKFNLPKFFKKFTKKSNDEKSETLKDLSKEVNITEHLLSVEELCDKLRTSAEKGLSDEEAEQRLKRDGLNQFTPPKQTPQWILFVKEMTGGFALLLWFASIACFIAYAIERVNLDYYLGIILALVVIITGSFSYFQQLSSSKVFDSFKNMIPPQTCVIREGSKKMIPASNVVAGDLVLCKSGERIAADIRVIKCESMKVDNSSLTGESDPLLRSPDAGHNSPLEAKNLAFFSTNCVDGSGYGIVISTGDRTVMGGIAKLVSNIKNEKTPIAIEIDRFVKIITVIAVLTGLIFFAIALGLGSTFFQAFIFMIGITVGNVPEGLLPALTVALTLTAKRMASKNCLVKYIEAVETLGSTTTICSDKTGTLTQNRMTASHCWLGNKIYGITHKREEVEEMMSPIPHCWDAYSRCCRLCSRAEFNEDDSEPDIMKKSCSGDASETAILRFMESVTGSVVKYRMNYPKIAEKPFSSTYKYQYSIHKNPENNAISVDGSMAGFVLVMKGAPERIIKLCSTILTADGHSAPLDEKMIEDFEETYRELGSLGERVIAFCDQEFTQFPSDYKFNVEEENFPLENFRFLGLISLIDPPRPSVPDAVAKCRCMGVKVIMVTGDHPITAQAIAKAVGIFSVSHRRSTRISLPRIDNIVAGNTSSIVVPGDELTELRDDELQEILHDCSEIVFARTSPQQKLRIVENCQALGQIVAVTGDGVNDSPALKKANIGVAMGITGSDVSKQAADMILLDDNFATIVLAIEEGRRIFDNMKKTVSYIMTGNVTTLYPFLVYVILGFPLAIGTITVLLICLGTDMVPAIALAYEKAESDIMNMPPRNPKTDKLVTVQLLCRAYLLVGIIATCCGYLGYFISMLHMGWKPDALWQLRQHWEDKTLVIVDSFNISHTYDDRQKELIRAQSSYFICIVVIQWMDVIVCKTRRLSIFQHGIWYNKVLLGSIVFETVLACFFCYTPDLNTVLQVSDVIDWIWLCGVPFFFYMLAFEELRKFVIRRWPQSCLGKELLA